METRYLYVDGVFKDPIASEEEEEKKQAKKSGNSSAVAEDFSDDKSNVSALTTKTNKTTSGKALDKHCPLCNLKLIRGKNWSRHCKDLHKEVVV
jgi:hypothetical protein